MKLVTTFVRKQILLWFLQLNGFNYCSQIQIFLFNNRSFELSEMISSRAIYPVLNTCKWFQVFSTNSCICTPLDNSKHYYESVIVQLDSHFLAHS